MSKGGLSAEESQKILKEKLEILKETADDEEMHFTQTLEITLDESPKIDDPNHDPRREEAFQQATLEGVKKAREMMDKLGIQYQRPPDMFAEMIRPEKDMEAIRDKLEKDKAAIQAAQARRMQKEVEKAPKPENKQKRPGIDLKYKKSAQQQKKDKKKAMRAK